VSAPFDSPLWRSDRNRRLTLWLEDEHAVRFVLDVGQVAEVWDDLIDKDKDVDARDINHVFFTLLTQLPLNPFFDRYKFQLTPLMITGINTWHDANTLETGSDNDKAMAYVLRDWYIELVMFVVYLLHGYKKMREVSMEIRRFFSQHESLQDYMEKLL
jgi:hypothetical protein